ncbi:MAG: DNA polymerase III subunit delta [Prevotellaceae bacterium]|jgi:DNA polymerase-3 subunit delta'|nr:DNA polymerase III subunit delta [Prevotellaceae bacterium]
MQFRNVIGHSELKQKLTATVADGRISHAQLFEGAAGYGSLPVALAYAQYVACTNRNRDDSCGVCPSCVKYAKAAHPDLHFAFPVNTTKTVKSPAVSDHFINEWRKMITETKYFSEQDWYEAIGIDKQGNISVHEAEKIISKLNFKSYESEYKIMILWLPERMNAASANRLLKLIEEPPTNTLFLFVTEASGKVLNTIYSRTQRIRLHPIDENDIATALADGETSKEQIYTAARLSEGNFITARSLLKSASNENFEKFVLLMRLAYNKNVIGLLEWAENMPELGRERMKTFLIYAERMVRENFILNMKLDEIAYLGFEEYEWAKKFSLFINKQNVGKLYKCLNTAILQIAQNGNAKIIFTDLALKIMQMIRQ